MSLVVLCFNLEFGGHRLFDGTLDHVEAYVRLMEAHRVDVACFQEALLRPTGGGVAVDVARLVARRLGFHHRAHPHHYLATIARWPLRVVGGRTRRHPILTCAIAGRWLVTNVHLTDAPFPYYSLVGRPYPRTPPHLRPHEAAALSFAGRGSVLRRVLRLHARAAKPRGIVLGDFNEPSDLDGMLAAWRCSRLLREHGFRDAGAARPLATYDVGKALPLRIDFVYVRGVDATVHRLPEVRHRGRKASDHRALLAELR